MRRLDIFQGSAGDVVELRIQPNAKFVSYVLFVRMHTENGHHTDSSHPPGANGEVQVRLVLQACKGYDLIFVGVPAPGGGANFKYELTFNSPLSGKLSKPVSILQSVPEAGWTIHI